MRTKRVRLTPRQKYVKERNEVVGRGVPPRWQEVFALGLVDYEQIMDMAWWGFTTPPAYFMEGYYARRFSS